MWVAFLSSCKRLWCIWDARLLFGCAAACKKLFCKTLTINNQRMLSYSRRIRNPLISCWFDHTNCFILWLRMMFLRSFSSTTLGTFGIFEQSFLCTCRLYTECSGPARSGSPNLIVVIVALKPLNREQYSDVSSTYMEFFRLALLGWWICCLDARPGPGCVSSDVLLSKLTAHDIKMRPLWLPT